MHEPLQFTGDKPPVAVIAGPTASGKSAYAVALAQGVQAAGVTAVVINADSAQMYADLAVLSARPSDSEMGGIVHRLFGTWDGASACSAADWATAAKREIAAVHAIGGVPVLVGGSGLYLRTLLDGVAPVPPIDPDVRAQVRALPQASARLALEHEDPDSAVCLAPADRARTQRALEVVRSTGRPISAWRAETAGGIGPHVSLDARILLPDRETLYARCDTRFAQMVERGAVHEVKALLARNLDPALPVMRAIGVPELAAYVRGDRSLDEAIAAGQMATRRYAKRQYTWFRRQPPADWRQIIEAPVNP
ncbi:tRNA (adenosine(37)-N6)-dimethylallyltransferase MiaA [Porphyrobacter sp. GA68]|uniref:tRNA (adenosine(37)-N6)-dimethylallyltransferase MiaA n=1 Tax=Porphyrobacter sp. GA68 TaxID=2883480 RepID=UPI0035931758